MILTDCRDDMIFFPKKKKVLPHDERFNLLRVTCSSAHPKPTTHTQNWRVGVASSFSRMLDVDRENVKSDLKGVAVVT